MTYSLRPLALLPMIFAASGCVGLGTNIEGDFSCRALKGTCAPTAVTDKDAVAGIASTEPAPESRAFAAGAVTPGDSSRTAERRLKVIFPAHIDQSGTLHEEAVAWIVVETPRWAAELQGSTARGRPATLLRAIRRQIRDAEGAGDPHADARAEIAAPPAGDPFVAQPFTATSPLPPPVPSEAREADAGPPLPAAGGLRDGTVPPDRVSRQFIPAPIPTHLIRPGFPNLDAVVAAQSAEEQKESK
ncbi:conjugal transfer protein TraV [uncultured Croceicoccus sp.]|uniref:conjugal transfer protein TraV n=1 Tax=uncultured Croceicoccus sp. TaxID=1295329 RepID=UPI002638B6B7|nr:conjugal transfer protein TraV [uncultured Croceicoccus sp.]